MLPFVLARNLHVSLAKEVVMHGFLGTRGTLLSDISLVLEFAIVAIVLVGLRFGRKHRGWPHHWTMLASTAVFLAFFVLYMVHRSVDPAATFSSHGMLYFALYLPVVIVHSLVSTVAFILGVFVSVQAIRKGARGARERSYALSADYLPRHTRIGVVSAWCYLLSAVTGIAVYYLLYVLQASVGR